MRKPRDILASMKDIPDIVSIDALEPECNTPMDPEDVLRLWQQQNNAKRITSRGGEKSGGGGGNNGGGGGDEWSRGNNRNKGDIWDAVGGGSDFEKMIFQNGRMMMLMVILLAVPLIRIQQMIS